LPCYPSLFYVGVVVAILAINSCASSASPGSHDEGIGIIGITSTFGDNNLHDLSFVPTVTGFYHNICRRHSIGSNSVAPFREAIDLCRDHRVIVVLQTFEPLFLLPSHV
jgi:hypothetical protein